MHKRKKGANLVFSDFLMLLEYCNIAQHGPYRRQTSFPLPQPLASLSLCDAVHLDPPPSALSPFLSLPSLSPQTSYLLPERVFASNCVAHWMDFQYLGEATRSSCILKGSTVVQ